MSIQLLDKTRKINQLLHNNNSERFVFDDICNVMADVLDAGVMVLSKKGKLLGISENREDRNLGELIPDSKGEFIDQKLSERLLDILSTKENVNLAALGFEDQIADEYEAIISPITISSDRLGTVIIFKKNETFGIDDIILSEYGTAVVGLEMLRSINEEDALEERKRQVAASAAASLSISEIEAVAHIFEELDGDEGILVASKIADKVGITRSVIVNALRKLESAGIIESRSSGMKGTYIKVLNDSIYEKLNLRQEEKRQ